MPKNTPVELARTLNRLQHVSLINDQPLWQTPRHCSLFFMDRRFTSPFLAQKKSIFRYQGSANDSPLSYIAMQIDEERILKEKKVFFK